MQTWAIANQKGGVGKTTTTLCLARGLVGAGHRVLLVDLDPHASLSHAFGVPTDPTPRGAYELFTDAAPTLSRLARETPVDGLTLCPAQPALATLERRGATQPGLGLALGRALHASRGAYDYVLLDCPPTLGLLMVNALAAADRLVAPTQTDPLALHGLRDMMRTADMVERSRRRPLPRAVIPTLHDRRTRSGQQSLDALRETYGEQVSPDPIPLDTRLRDAAAVATGPTLASRGADAYREALQWLLDPISLECEAA
ncbi:chromosome partioning protein [Lysobacter xinjiangensis]|uniref:Chromosome partioning protein n=1 Tax=Cognatilysobacter xinjiangensis TaxID=546892 RepID=A0ABQ3BNL1_9GAMM|nr:ParA family protein [Lysobacter xinjiangensis]GGZ52614.1 chromosome partioning protein [Lysobacter xinjiangensis]